MHQTLKPQVSSFTIKRSWGKQSKALNNFIKLLPLQNYYLHIPSILLMKESKHIEYYNFVDKQKWNDKYLLMAASITFLVTCSYIFEDVKILTDRKFDISFFFSEIPLSSGETMAILASFGKVPFDILFISFEIDLHKTIVAILASLGGIISKSTVFFCVKCTQKFKLFFSICPTKSVIRYRRGQLIFGSTILDKRLETNSQN